jgi:hypothetical protein
MDKTKKNDKEKFKQIAKYPSQTMKPKDATIKSELDAFTLETKCRELIHDLLSPLSQRTIEN